MGDLHCSLENCNGISAAGWPGGLVISAFESEVVWARVLAGVISC